MLRKTVRRVAKFEILVSLLFAFVKSCPIAMQQGWKQMSVEKRAQSSEVIAVGKAIQKFPVDVSIARQTYPVNFQFVDVLKGKDITDDIHDDTGSSLFTIYGFGNAGQCLSSINEGDTYLLFLIFERSSMSLLAAYESAFSATAPPTKENCARILTSLGWKPWSDWSACSATCGGGTQTRRRECRIAQCNEPSSETRDCNEFDCEDVTDLLSKFKEWGRNTRSAPVPLDRNAFPITSAGNFSVPTHKIFTGSVPQNFTIFARAKYMNYIQGYLISFYDNQDRLQIGVKVNKTSVALEYVEVGVERSKVAFELAFDAEVVDRKWHQFAFSYYNNGQASFYLDCKRIGTKKFAQDGVKGIDITGDTYLSGKTLPPQVNGGNIEFYIQQLSLTEDPTAGEKQCIRIDDLYPIEYSGSGVVPKEIIYIWSAWTKCSKTCGDLGVRKRVKMCKDIEDNRGKSQCQAIIQRVQIEPCNKTKCPAHCQQHCTNGGNCIAKNKCSCQPGYYGVSCEKAIPCRRKCINGGRCNPSRRTCKCPKGFGGKYCEKASCYPPCQNGGLCVKPGICKCRQGYVPPICKPSCVPPCMNQGTCVMPGRCHCRKGYVGKRCRQATCTKPCLNGGRCYNRDKCICKHGWTGDTCNRAICHPECLNGGLCIKPDLCSCPSETRGTYCQNVVCHPRCINGGTCVKGNKCVCSSWYRGDRCQTSLCKHKCNNGGKCVAPNQCACPSGYFGAWCERTSCIHKTRVVPQKRTHRVPITTTYPKMCYHRWAWRPCMEERTEYRTVHTTSYRTIYYCG